MKRINREEVNYLQREGEILDNKPKINDSVIYFLLYMLIMSIFILVVSEHAIYLLAYLIESAIVLFLLAEFYSKFLGYNNNPFVMSLLTLFAIFVVTAAIIKNPHVQWRMDVYNKTIIATETVDLTNRDIAKILYPVIYKIQQIKTAFDIFDTTKKFETDGMFKKQVALSDSTTSDTVEESSDTTTDETLLNKECEQDKISIKTDTTFSGVQCIGNCEYAVADVEKKSDSFFVVKLKFNNQYCKGEK